MAIGPAAWAQELPRSGDPALNRDAGTPSTAGAGPGPPQRRDRNRSTTPGTTGAEGTAGTRAGTTADDASRSNTAAPTAGMEGDVDTVAKIHQANQREIEMAQMALDKAESPKVKAYARKLLNDHQAG